MSQLIEFELEEGGSILVEVTTPTGGVAPVAGGVIGKATKKFEEALSELEPIANAIINKLGQLVNQPDEVAVEFGLKFNVKGNLIIAAGEGEASLKTTMHWRNLGVTNATGNNGED